MKKLLSLILTILLMLTLFPVVAMAASSAGTYSDLQGAISGATDGVATTVTLSADIADMTAYLSIPAGKNIVIELNGHSIDRNLSTAAVDGCVIKVASGSTLTVQDTVGGGMITGGNNSGFGGGIYNAGTLYLSGGSVSANTGAGFGGGIYNAGSFTMSGGMISYNKVLVSDGHGEGGGVYNCIGAVFTLSCRDSALAMGLSGIINQNTAVDGGGVYNAGTFALSGGRVKANTSTRNDSTNNLATVNPVQIIDKLATGTDIRFELIADTSGISAAAGAVTVDYQTGNPGAEVNTYFTYDGANNYTAELQKGEIALTKTGDEPTPIPDPVPHIPSLWQRIQIVLDWIRHIRQKIQEIYNILRHLPELLKSL